MLQYQFDCLCSDVIAHNARVFKNDVAVVCEDRRLTWPELDEATNRFANALHGLGLSKGDKVCIFMPNSMETFVAFWGVIKAGCVVVPVNTMLDRESFARTVNSSDAAALFTSAAMRELVESAREHLVGIPADRYVGYGFEAAGWRRAEPLIDAAAASPPQVRIALTDSMTIIYTSGSTGLPKGIEHAHYGRINYMLGFSMALTFDRYSVAICSTPIFATGTWQTMFPAMCNGGKVVILPKFTPEAVLQAVQAEGGTHTFMVPAQYIALLQANFARYDTGSLKVLLTAGQPLPDVTREALQQAFARTRIVEVYGMTEGFSTVALPEDMARGKRGTVGKPSFFDDVRVIDGEGVELLPGKTGEIVAYGPAMMKGYYGNPELTAAATWISPTGRNYIRSGDLGYLDEDGFLYYVGRLKDMIKSGGINIYAIDIEQVLMKHPDVREAAVIGVSHPKWVETPLAVVVLHEGAKQDQADELMSWLNERLAKYQRVSGVVIQQDMPRVTYGKVQKQALRDKYAKGWN